MDLAEKVGLARRRFIIDRELSLQISFVVIEIWAASAGSAAVCEKHTFKRG